MRQLDRRCESVRAMLAGIPAALAPLLVDAADAVAADQIIEDHVRETLNSFADRMEAEAHD